MKRHNTTASTFLTLFAIFASAPALAQDLWDAERGTIALDPAAFAIGFEQAEPAGLDVYRYDSNPRPADESLAIETSDFALEGTSVGVLGGDTRRMAWRFDDDTIAALTGRRVEFRVWYRPEGTAARARIAWISGSVAGQLERAEPSFFVHTMGGITLQPTGRATDDGWIELGSGPVDFLAGAQLPPAYVSIEDANAFDSGTEGVLARDPEARALVDAFSVVDLGEAAVADVRCSATTEDTCGEFGLCHLGHCTDAAIYLGAAPQDEQLRQDYLDRRRFEVANFNGVRRATDDLAPYDAHLAAADTANSGTFWTEMIRSVNGLVDGHSRAPSARQASVVAGGACAYIGAADLLPNSPEAPVVFESFEDVPYGARMQPGDVIESIDGLAPMEFAALLDREVNYGGDPRARAEILTPDLLGWAAQTGSTWDVARCSNPAGCTEAEVERFTIDPYDELAAPIWQGAPPSFRFRIPLCDYRVQRLNETAEERAYGFAGSLVRDGITEVLFNGFPRANTGGGQSGWLVTLTNVMESQPDMVLLDQRWGTGGFPDALEGLTSLLLAASDPPLFGETFPAGLIPTGRERGNLQARCITRNCGMYALFGITPDVDGPAANTRIAVMNGYDVSANDFFARRLAERPGRTRIFGHAPTFGAYGFACQLPPHLPGEAPVGYQCTDTGYTSALGDAQPLFESGTGVEPDEVVRQRQSDLLEGVDTMRERAIEWLRDGQ